MPDNVRDEEAAVLGLGIATVGQGLYQSLKLPLPTQVATTPEPILIYDGSTSAGILGIQFAKLSGFTVVTTSSPKNFEYVKSAGADAVFDYSNADECLANIRSFLGPQGVRRAWDCVANPETARIRAHALFSDEDSYYSSLLLVDAKVLTAINPTVHVAFTVAYTAFGEEFEKWSRTNGAKPQDYKFAMAFFEIASDLLKEGKLKPVRQTVNRDGEGLASVVKGLQDLKEGNMSARKLVYTL